MANVFYGIAWNEFNTWMKKRNEKKNSNLKERGKIERVEVIELEIQKISILRDIGWCVR